MEPTDDDRGWAAKTWVSATGTGGGDAVKMLKVHSHPRAWELIRSDDGAARYALKYATKTKQKKVPEDFQDVGRFWGCSRDVSRSAKEMVDSVECGEFDVRLYALARGRDMSTYDNLPGHIWVSEIDSE